MHSKNTSFSTTMISSTITIFMLCSLMNNAVLAQRPSYAGPRPQSGYKDRYRPITDTPAQADLSSRFDDNPNRVQQPPSTSVDIVQPISGFIPINNQASNQIPEVANRFSSNSANSDRLPYDARGDRELVERLNRLPVDQRPFWLVNAEAIEAHRNRNPSQLGNSNVIAERGSFLGSGSLSNNNRQGQQFQQPRQQPQNLPSRNDFDLANRSGQGQQFQQLRQQPRNLPSRNNINVANRSGQGQQFQQLRQQPQNLPSRNNIDVANRSGDSQNGRFVYVQPEVYNALRSANLIP